MPSAADNGGPFQVDCSRVVARELRRLQERAVLEGRGDLVAAAFRQILKRLKHDPRQFGEPLYRLPALRMQIRQGAIRPLFINFGVCEDRPLVFVRGVKLL